MMTDNNRNKSILQPPLRKRFKFLLSYTSSELEETNKIKRSLLRQDPESMTQEEQEQATATTEMVPLELYKYIKPITEIRKALTKELSCGDVVEVSVEFSVHRPPPGRFKSELKEIFPEFYAPTTNGNDEFKRDLPVNVIPVFQKSKYDLVGTGPEIEHEKDLLLQKFFLFALTLCHRLRSLGYWADFTDPASGYPFIGNRGSSYYPDVHASQRLLMYEFHQTGCCSMLKHPKWGTNVYPSTCFSNAPVEVLVNVLSAEMHGRFFQD